MTAIMDKLEFSCSSASEVMVPEREYGVIRSSSQHDVENPPIAILSRVETARSQYAATVGIQSSRRNDTMALPGFGEGKTYPPKLEPQDAYVVDFDGPDDPMHAMNWPFKKK
jgi:MFS transporter, DHA1 family, multidrug resistance protein